MDVDPVVKARANVNDNKNKDTDNNNLECYFDKWVDYLPHHVEADERKNQLLEQTSPQQQLKRTSLDVTESQLTESQDDDDEWMDTEHWPDSGSLEDYAMVPNAMLIEHDPVLQHELLLTDPTIHEIMVNEQFTSSLQDVLEDRRRVLIASMEASRRTRRCLEPHIKQRASLASVLADIEGSSQTLQRALQHSMSSPTMEDAPDAMAIVPMEEDEEMLASALDLEPDEPPPPTPSDL